MKKTQRKGEVFDAIETGIRVFKKVHQCQFSDALALTPLPSECIFQTFG